MGMVIGVSWNGVCFFIVMSGLGVLLMSEFIGLVYFVEILVVLVNVQWGGLLMGMLICI